VFCEVVSTICDSAAITSVVPNGGLSILSSIRETEKNRMDKGMTVVLFLVKNFLVKREV
jgi:hypothetical protein